MVEDFAFSDMKILHNPLFVAFGLILLRCLTQMCLYLLFENKILFTR